MSLPTVAHPGQFLGSSAKFHPGPGTHVDASSIYASLCGRPIVIPASSGNPSTTSPKLPTLSIPRILPSPVSRIPSRAISNTNTLPTVGSTVLCRVTRILLRQVDVRILQVEDQICSDEWAGVVRKEDVRATERDMVKVGEGFRPGDLVRAVVISLGDSSNYYLSTAKNELGVILAKSEAGNTMIPISWKEFEDPVTGLTETRKVAKPF